MRCTSLSRTFLLVLHINVLLPTSFATKLEHITMLKTEHTRGGSNLLSTQPFFASDYTRKTDTQYCDIFRQSPYAMHKINMKRTESVTVTLSSLLSAWFSMHSTLYRTILWCCIKSASIPPV